MGSGNLKRVEAGQPFQPPAGDWNAFVDAAIAHRQRENDLLSMPGRGFTSPGIALVKNSSGSGANRFDVLGIGSPIFGPSVNLDEFKNGTALIGLTPQFAQHFGSFAVLLEPLASGAIGRAVVSGRTRAKVDVIHEADEYADIKDNDATQLESTGIGAARILWKESGTGVKWAEVRIGAVAGTGRYELTEDLTAGDSAAAKRLAWNGTIYVKVGSEITVWDDLYVNVVGNTGDTGVFFIDHGKRVLETINCP